MGTRNLVCVVKDGEYKVAQYGQWDGYPGGQGITALNFLRKRSRKVFEKKLKKVSFATKEEIFEQWKECGADESGWVSLEIAKEHKRLYPENSRDTGAEILKLIHKSKKLMKLDNSIEFAGNSLFCEWAYVIDLDKSTFEVYKGFNKNPLNEEDRFFKYREENSEYYPVKLAASFDLNNLPEEKDFLNTFRSQDEEE